MCVLMVEADLVLRIAMAAALRRAGHEVEEACSAREALDVFDRRPERFTVLVADVRLLNTPDGRHVADHVHARCPDLPIVVASGVDARDALWRRTADFLFLPKPYRAYETSRSARDSGANSDSLRVNGFWPSEPDPGASSSFLRGAILVPWLVTTGVSARGPGTGLSESESTIGQHGNRQIVGGSVNPAAAPRRARPRRTGSGQSSSAG